MNQKKIVNATFFLAICTLIQFIFKGSHTVYEWTTSQDIPLVLRSLDPSFLLNDFYTNSVVDSPRFFFTALVVYVSKLGFDWESVFYFYKVIFASLYRAVYFFIFILILDLFMKDKWDAVLRKKSIFAFMLIFLFDLISVLFNKGGAPVGWASITHIKTYIPMSLSAILGMLFIHLEIKSKKYISVFVVVLMSLFHPAVAIGFVGYWALALLFIKISKENIVNILTKIILGVFVPALFLKINYKTEALNSLDFVNHYVFLRHPHHYSILYNFNFKTVFIGSLFVISTYLLRVNKQFFKWSLYGLITFFAPLIVQLVFVDILKVKLIAIIGPSRFTTFSALILLFELYLVYFIYREKLSFRKIRKLFDHLFEKYERIKFPEVRYQYFVVSILLLVAYFGTIKSPIKEYKNGNFINVSNWIKENTPENATFYVYRANSFIFRKYANRAVYADIAFPFNESYVKEFSKRYLIFKNSKKFTDKHYKCISNRYDVDYLLISRGRSDKITQYNPVFKDDDWVVYNLKENIKTSLCENSELFYKYASFKDLIKP